MSVSRLPRGPVFQGPRTFRNPQKSTQPSTTTAAVVPVGTTTIAASQIMMDMRLQIQGVLSTGPLGPVTTFVTPCPFFGNVAVQQQTGIAAALTMIGVGLNENRWFSAAGNLSSGLCILGTYAPMRVDLSEVVARESNDKPEIDLGVLLRHLIVLHDSYNGFGLRVSNIFPSQWPTYTLSYAPDLSLPTVYPLTSRLHRFRAHIGQIAERVTLSITEDTWKPVRVASLEAQIECMDSLR